MHTSDDRSVERAPERLDQLTSLRFFAALAVLSSHLWLLQDAPNLLRPVATAVFHEGYAGVSFFFMLSGFILSHTYQRKLRRRQISPGRYLLLRAARIFPLHLLTALPFAIALLWTSGVVALPTIMLNVALLQSWAPSKDFYFTLNAPSWSLSDELFFYVAFAGLAFVTRRTLVRLTVGLAIIAAFIVAGLLFTGHASWSINGQLGLPHWLTYINPAVRLLDFLVGMLIYRCRRFQFSDRLSTTLEIVSPAALVAAMACFSMFALPEVLRAQLLYLPFMAFVVHTYAQGGGWVSRHLSGKRLVLLGDASFALYMIHLPILNAASAQFERFDEPIPVAIYAAAVTLVCILVSIVTFKYVERPIHRRLRHMINSAQ